MANKLEVHDVYTVSDPSCEGYELKIVRTVAGECFFAATQIAGAAGFKSVRDVAGRHVPADHRFLVSSPDAERISGNPKTKTLTLVDLAGAETIVARSRNCTAQRAAGLLRLCRAISTKSAAGTIQLPVKEPPMLFGEPNTAGGPGAVDESLILAQALEIANRKLAAAKVKSYPPNHLFTATEIGDPFGLAAMSLNRILEKERVQYSIRRDGRQTWVLVPEYRGRNLAYERDVEKNGHRVRCLLWTWKGKQAVEEVLKRAGFVKRD